MRLLKYIAEKTLAMVSRTYEEIHHLKIDVSARQSDKILEWLCPHDYSKQFEDNRARYLPGTGQWFLKHKTFLYWLNVSGSCTLFCPGNPGTGKTILSTLAIENLLAKGVHAKMPVMYLFCDYKRKNEQTLAHLTASLLRQLAFQSVEVFHEIKQLHDRCMKEKMLPSFPELQTKLESALKSVAAVSIIVDALDECETRVCEGFLSAIETLSRQCEVRLLVTSRPLPTVRSHPALLGKPTLEVRGSEEDLEKYIRSRTSELQPRVMAKLDLLEELITSTVSATGAMYA